MDIEKTKEIGLCFGVRRAVDILKKAARKHGGVETLGAVVHNRQVLEGLAAMGVEITDTVEGIKGDTVVVSAHGISPQTEAEIKKSGTDIIDTTCPFVRRAQASAQSLADDGFFVIIYGDADHPEVKGVLGWAENNGIAALNDDFIAELEHLPRRLGVLSQTTQVPACFNEFVKKLVDSALVKDTELRVIDTICHDIRGRQAAALELAGKVDLMLVIGGQNSANTNRLAELCSAVVETHFIETADDMQSSWFQDGFHIGVTAGASTAELTVEEVISRLKTLDC